MLNRKSLIKFVTMLGIGVSLLGVGSVTANASSKPYYGSLYSRKLTYHVKASSKHWKNIWKGAINSWNSLHVVKLRATKKASNADIRLTTVKRLKNNTYLFDPVYDGFEHRGSIYRIKVSMNRQALTHLNETELGKEKDALWAVGMALGLESNDDKTSALSGYASKPSAKDKANLKLAYKGIK
ncbi:hypothetical protein [Levilactobacillus tongjiangensis]|uniref:Uncharacterized protein n=1 Tax=Levilactobacillus tongjiangensis TaxID=2486023 RepID=A0ABW1SVS3_9LACO|nr:hypothetical protein [Levilactobacillus tongjiangensis]